MLHGSCHCGRVKIEVDRRPRTLTECNCSICRRYAARWMYCNTDTARVLCKRDDQAAYTYKQKTYLYHHCKRCGCVTHYSRPTVGDGRRIAINARMLDPDDLARIPVRKLDVRKNRRG